MQKTLIILMEKCLAKVSKILPMDDSSGQKIKNDKMKPSKWYGWYFWFLPWCQHGFGCSFSSKVLWSCHDQPWDLYQGIWLILRCKNCVRTISDASALTHGQLIDSTLFNHSKLSIHKSHIKIISNVEIHEQETRTRQFEAKGLFKSVAKNRINILRPAWSRKINSLTAEHASSHLL